MGRTIVGEEAIEDQIISLYNKDKWKIGLLIGQITEQKDYVVHLAPTPNAENVEDVDNEPNKGGKAETLENVDESWIVTHTRQVLRMLPGGLGIVGVFGLAPPDMMKAAQAKLRQVLFAVHKVASGWSCTIGGPPSTDRVILQLCSLTRKLICRTYDVSDNKSCARPADWKYQKFSERWHRVDTTLVLDRVIPVPNSAMSQSLERQLLQGIQPICDNVCNSLATVDQQVVSGDRPLNPNQPSGKKSKKQQSEESGGLVYTIDLFHKKRCMSQSDISEPKTMPCGAKLALRGAMCCRAFVHSKATVSDAIKALKTDIVRTLTARCELLCEDLLQAEEEQDTKVLYETPVRVFCPLPESSAQLCDYMFQDETNNDVVDRLKELIGLTLPEDLLETDCEGVPDDRDILRSDDIADSCETSVDPHSQGSSQTILLLCLLAALFAVVVAFLLNGESAR